MPHPRSIGPRLLLINISKMIKIARPIAIALGIATLSLAPNYSSALELVEYTKTMRLALKLSDKGMHDEAIKTMNMAIKLDPMDSDAYFWRGFLKLEKNIQDASAIDDFNQAIRISPKHFSSHLYRASIYGNTKDYKNALSDWKTIIRIDPTNSQNYNGQAYWFIDGTYNLLGEIDVERSCDLLKKAKELGYTKPFTNETLQEFC